MTQNEAVKYIRQIWRDMMIKRGVDEGYLISYNDKRGFGRRIKLWCRGLSTICGDYYKNIKYRDKIIKKIRKFIKNNNVTGTVVDGHCGGYSIVVFMHE